jgi:predicted Zn-dependent protease
MRTVADRIRVKLALVMLALVSACAVVPGSGRMQFNIISPGEERRMGRQSFAEIKRRLTISQDANATAMVQRVGKRIAQVANLPNADWEFVLFQNSEPNAFALPGGKVGIYSGMLSITKDEAGLATVMAHEVAHAVAHHGAERMSEQLLMEGIAVAMLSSLSDMDNKTRLLLFTAYGLGTTFGRVLPHSRLQESEADNIGLIYMARAGYDPEQAVEFWKRFAEYKRQQGGTRGPAFLSTHPLDEQRIENLKRLMPKAKLQYRPR